MKLLIMTLLALLPAMAGAAEFGDLQRMGAAEVAAAEAPAAEKWGVGYKIDGVLNIREGRIILNTPDGRLFELEMAPALARKYDGLTVLVDGRVMQADDLDVLKVSSIELYAPLAQTVLPVYSPAQRRASLITDDPQGLSVANVRWLYGAPAADKFDWTTARIRPELVKEVYFIKKPFPPEWIAAHSLLVFTFAGGGLTDAGGNESPGLALSIEAYLKEGENFSIIDGLKDRFGIVWGLSTWEEYAARAVLAGERLFPYRLKDLPDVQKRELVKDAVRFSAVNRDGEFYNTVTNNCTNNLVILMNRALPERRRITMWSIPYMVYNIAATMPVTVPGYLQNKGLLGPELPVVNASNYKEPLP
ncbi:MAG: DUF4105 domain-containing protein [Elusimicrobiota bacterium]